MQWIEMIAGWSCVAFFVALSMTSVIFVVYVAFGGLIRGRGGSKRYSATAAAVAAVVAAAEAEAAVVVATDSRHTWLTA